MNKSIFTLLLVCSSVFCYGGNTSAPEQIVKGTKKQQREIYLAANKFEKLWDGILDCNMRFYSLIGEEDAPFRYLRGRGYDLQDTGDGYLKAENLNEVFHGYKVSALVLPGEWVVYDLELEAEAQQVARSLFYSKHLKAGFDEKGKRFFSAMWQRAYRDELPNEYIADVFLTIHDRTISRANPRTLISCRIDTVGGN